MRPLLPLLALSLATIARPSIAHADDLSPGRALTLRIGAGADVLVGPDRVAPTGWLAGLLPIGEWLGVEFIASMGVDPESGVGRAWVGLQAGVRAEIPLGAWRPYASLRLAHLHDAPLDAWGSHFGETLSGDPTYGLAHVTSLGGAIGLAVFVPGTEDRLVIAVEATGLGRVHGHRSGDHDHAGQHRVPDGWLGGSASIGWQFL